MVFRPVSYKRHRFPPEIIAQAVWLYFRFPLSQRLVEEMLLERSILVCYENHPAVGLKLRSLNCRTETHATIGGPERASKAQVELSKEVISGPSL
jgi:transposase-like protein